MLQQCHIFYLKDRGLFKPDIFKQISAGISVGHDPVNIPVIGSGIVFMRVSRRQEYGGMRGYLSDDSVNAKRSDAFGAVENLRMWESSAPDCMRLTVVLTDIINEYGETKLLVFDGIIIEIHFHTSTKRWYYCYNNILSFIDSFVNKGIINIIRYVLCYS